MTCNRTTAATLLLTTVLAACDGSSGGDEGDPAFPVDENGRLTVVNGFVERSSVTLNANGAVLFRGTTRVDAEANALVSEGEDFTNGERSAFVLRHDDFGDLVRTEATYTLPDALPETDVWTFEHDARGLLRSRTTVYAGGFVETERFRYDEDDRLLGRETREGTAEDGALIEGIDYAYEGRRRPVSGLYRYVEPDGEVSRVERLFYTHDGAGRLVALRFDAGDDGGIDGELTYEYDASGNMLRRTRTDETGAVTRVREFDYEAVDAPIYNRWIRALRYFL